MVAGMMTNRGAAEERTDRQLAARQRTADRRGSEKRKTHGNLCHAGRWTGGRGLLRRPSGMKGTRTTGATHLNSSRHFCG